MEKAGDMGRVGIMGGTFDPVHLAHIEMARCALGQKGLDKILFMPSKNPPHKRDRKILPEKYRAEMVKLAVSGEEKFYFSDFELRREEITYTAKTLELLCKNYPKEQFFFIMGSDSLCHFECWHQPEKVMRYAVILAVSRGGVREEEMVRQAAYLSKKFSGDVQVLKMPEMKISSSMIREKIAAGEDVSSYLPENVYDYILKHHCYRLELE